MAADTKVKTQYEYCKYRFNPGDPAIQDKLNNCGLSGWELVSVTQSANRTSCVFWFKREKG